MPDKKKVLFIHNAYPNQLSALHEYFQKAQEVESYFLTWELSRAERQFDKDFPQNVFTFAADGYITEHSYYYTGEIENVARSAVNALKAVKKILQHHALDLIVAHDRSGFPYLLYDELDIPIIGYSEFPDFKQYGWDEQYPPMHEQTHTTLLTQAFTYQAVTKSAVTIVPSEYARQMYPELLQQKIVVQMDAFDADKRTVYLKEKAAFNKEDNLTYIGFAANALSSEKGLEHFIQISKRIYEASEAVRFVIIGSEISTSCYGYERQFLDAQYGKDNKSFLRYLFEKYSVDVSKYIVTGHLSGDAFSSTLHHVDFFLYPLQYGSANWGLFELLTRGKIVIASNRCFIPEVITDNVNGFICDLDNHDAWCDLALDIIANKDNYQHIAEHARELSRKYHVDRVAQNYLQIFDQWAWKKNIR